jgi:hypothetical protein
VEAPAVAVPRDAQAILIAVVKIRDADGRALRTEARRHVVTARQLLAADRAPEKSVLVDVARGAADATAQALIADLAAASSVVLLPE